MLYRRRISDTYGFEYGKNNNNSCSFLLYPENTVECAKIKEVEFEDLSTRWKVVNCYLDIRSQANSYRETRILSNGYVKIIIKFRLFWTIRVPTQGSRSTIFLLTSSSQVERCCLSSLRQNLNS